MTKNARFAQTFKKYYPFLILLGLLFYYFFTVEILNRDDVNFKKLYQDFPSVLSMRWLNWTSRVIIESFLMYLTGQAPFIWRVITPLLFTVMGVTIAKITSVKDHIGSWLIAFLIILLCQTDISSAGWISTTLNYSWPAVAGVIAIYPLTKMIKSQWIRWFEYVLYIPALIFAANHELMAAILTACYALGAVFLVYQKRSDKMIFLLLLLAIASLIFIFVTPGNHNRFLTEIQSYFPDYEYFSFFQKVDIGISHTIRFFLEPNAIILLFLLTMNLRMFTVHREPFFRTISVFPLLMHVAFAYLEVPLSLMFTGFPTIKQEITRYGLLYVNSNFVGFGTFFVLSVSLFCILLSIWIIYGNQIRTVFIQILLILGFGSRMIMGFSPTVIASNLRTGLFMFIALMIATVILFLDQSEKPNSRWAQPFFYFSGFLAMLGYISLFGNGP